MEVKANDLGKYPNVILLGLLQHTANNTGHIWAGFGVKSGAELSIGSPKHHCSQQKKGGSHLKARHILKANVRDTEQTLWKILYIEPGKGIASCTFEHYLRRGLTCSVNEYNHYNILSSLY
ncbi:hypothetical protein V6N13_106704 [Hibiscus sabdariffa]